MTYCTHDCPAPCIKHVSLYDWIGSKDDKRDMAYEVGCPLEVPGKDANENQCVMCGAVIPEGRQLCPHCESDGSQKRLMGDDFWQEFPWGGGAY